MAQTPEAVAELTRLLDQATRSSRQGIVSEGVRGFIGILPYSQRLVGHPDQPLTFSIKVQPTFALQIGERTIPLAYPKDVEDLGEPLATQVVNFLSTLTP